MIYTPIESPYQIVTKYAVLGIIWSEFPLKKFKKPFFIYTQKAHFKKSDFLTLKIKIGPQCIVLIIFLISLVVIFKISL